MHFKPHTELRALAISTRLCPGTGDAVWEKSQAEREGEIDQINVEKSSYQRRGQLFPTKAKNKGQSMHEKSKWI